MAKSKGEGQFPFRILEDKIPIFKSGGRYPQLVSDANPEGLATQAMIEDIASSYNPDKMLSPLTVDHEQFGEAKGRVGSLSVSGNTLMMKVKSVVTEFRDALKEGKYLYPSVELYEPRHHANPSPGRWYLKAVTFLGAAAPAVKGLYAGFKERWVVPDAKGKVLCFCSELNNVEEVDMTPEEIQKQIDASLKANNKTLMDSIGESMKVQFSEFAKSLPKPADPKPKDDNKKVDFSEVIQKERQAREAIEAKLKKFEEAKAEADKVAIGDTAKAFTDTLLSEARMTPADIKEKIEPRVAYFVEKLDMDSLVAFRDSIMSTTTKNTVFKEIAPDMKEKAEKAGITLVQESQIRRFGEDFGDENATPENLELTRSGIAKFNEQVKAGATSDQATLLNAMCEAQREQLLKGATR